MLCENMYISVLHASKKKCITLCLTGRKLKLLKKRKSRRVHREGPDHDQPTTAPGNAFVNNGSK